MPKKNGKTIVVSYFRFDFLGFCTALPSWYLGMQSEKNEQTQPITIMHISNYLSFHLFGRIFRMKWVEMVVAVDAENNERVKIKFFFEANEIYIWFGKVFSSPPDVVACR